MGILEALKLYWRMTIEKLFQGEMTTFYAGEVLGAKQSAYELEEGARLYDGKKVRPTPLAPPVASIRRHTCVNPTPLLAPRHIRGCKYIFIPLYTVHLIVSIIAVAYHLDPALAVLKWKTPPYLFTRSHPCYISFSKHSPDNMPCLLLLA